MIQQESLPLPQLASVSTSIVSAQTHQTDDPENTITGVISKRRLPQPVTSASSSPHPIFSAPKSP
ncbi:MAG: hypothetical protein ACLVB1_03585 [Blautia obeum]